MLTFGNRYASNQFEGYVPTQYYEEYHLIGKGGVAGIVTSMASRLQKVGPTKLRLLGYAKDDNRAVINTRYLSTRKFRFDTAKKVSFKTVLSIGSSMDSGKTTSAAYLCRGLKAAGHKVVFFKLTGTVFNKDKMLAYDCGADVALDFAEFGFPSTYLCSMANLLDIYEGLRTLAQQSNPDYVVIEIADGLLQRETDMLISNKQFMSTIDHVLLSIGDSLSALQGINSLRSKGISPFAISGLINTRPLLVDEVKKCVPLPLLGLEDLASAKVIERFVPSSNKVKNNGPLNEKDLNVLEVA